MGVCLSVRRALACAVVLVALGHISLAETRTEQTGTLLAGTGFATDWLIIDSGVPGETVLVTGGVHGNEPAGALAAEQISHWEITQGRLVVIPRVNRLGLKADTRWIPAFRNDKALRDLNRNFPESDEPVPQTDLAVGVWEFVTTLDPDWVFDLHEGFDFHALNDKSVGSSVITFPADEALARGLVDEVNALAPEDKPFVALAGSGPVAGSLARACGEVLGAHAFIFETTSKDQPISLRARQHRVMVQAALLSIGMLGEPGVDVLGPGKGEGTLNVGVFDDSGASEAQTLAALRTDPAIYVTPIGRHDTSTEALARFDVLVFPGGSGSKQGKALGEHGRQNVRGFINDGGGYLGICAGAYLSSSHYDWSLHLMNTACFNTMVKIEGKGKKSMWYRGGPADLEVELLPGAADLLGLDGTQTVRYHNGPILSEGQDADAPGYEILAWFREENGMYEAQKGTMINTPAVVRSRFGEGTVLAISPHFESTKGLEQAIVRAVHAIAEEPVSQ